MRVLESLLCGFQNRVSGLCCPSIEAIQEATGLSRSAIFEALNRLEAAGILKRVQRQARRVINFGGMARPFHGAKLQLVCLLYAKPSRSPLARAISPAQSRRERRVRRFAHFPLAFEIEQPKHAVF